MGRFAPLGASRLERIAPLLGLGWSDSLHPPSYPAGSDCRPTRGSQGGRRGQAVAVGGIGDGSELFEQRTSQGRLLAREPSCFAADSLWIMEQARFGELRWIPEALSRKTF